MAPEATAPSRPAVAAQSGVPARGAALRIALQAASAGLLPAPQGAFCLEAGSGGPAELLQAPIGPTPPGLSPTGRVVHGPPTASTVLVARGEVPWAALSAALAALEPISSGRWSVDEVQLNSLLNRPHWEGDPGFAGEQVALEAGRALLRRKPGLIVLAPGVRTVRNGHLRSVAWPRGRVGLRPTKRAELHDEDLGWQAVAGLLDAVVEVVAAGLPAPSFVLLLPEAFSSAHGRARLEPLYESRLAGLAAVPGVLTGAFFQCDWARLENAAEPMRIVSNVPALLKGCYMGLPVRRPARGPDGGRLNSYHAPLPSSCSCGAAHIRRPAAVAALAEPLEAGPSRQLALRLEDHVQQLAAGPLALFGGEVAALALLSGPPSRGPPVEARSAGGVDGWRPLDLYVCRNDRFGDPVWGNPFKVKKGADAAECCRTYEEWLRANVVLWRRLDELRGRRLRCHCPPSAPCHTDSLIRLFCLKMSEDEVAPPPSAALGSSRVPVASPPPSAALGFSRVPAASPHPTAALSSSRVPAAWPPPSAALSSSRVPAASPHPPAALSSSRVPAASPPPSAALNYFRVPDRLPGARGRRYVSVLCTFPRA